MTLSEKAAYIQGLADGLDLDESTKEGKLIAALIDIVGELADAIDEIDDDLDTLNDYIEEIDEDLGDVEEYLYDDCDCCDCDDDDEYECDGNCCDCDEDCELADEDFFEVECPSCGEVICFDGSIDPEDIACPACGEKFECIIAEEDLDDLKALDAE